MNNVGSYMRNGWSIIAIHRFIYDTDNTNNNRSRVSDMVRQTLET